MTEETVLTFAEMALAPALQKVVIDVGYETPSPIQAQSIPLLLEGRDLLGQAQTGTGKTAAFALPLLSRLDPKLKVPQILVLTPTRELALQVAEAMQTYARHLPGFNVLPVYGGQNMIQQLRMLSRGVQVVVGTPGRVQDHLRRGTLKLDKIKAVVLDEADEMLRMGFVDDVEEILSHAPAGRQTALFSATMPKEVLRVARQHMRDPVEIRIKTKTSTVETISQHYWQVKGMHKLDALTRILEAEEIEAMIVFVRTKTATVELAEKLEARGFSSAPLNGDMTQVMREKAISRLKSGSLDIVVATDVAARGLDVPRISHVVNYDIPYDTEAYVHRIGRTGRAGKMGKAILFVAPRERRMLNAIEQATRQPIKAMTLPSRKDITDRRIGLFKEQIAEAMEAEDLEFFEELVDSYQSEYDVGHRRIAATLAYLVQKGRPLQPDESPSDSALEKDFRPEQTERTKRPSSDEALQRYRIEVGRSHGVEPRHIVGAISNEANLSSRDIGQIKIHDDYCMVDLPASMPTKMFQHLQEVWVCGQQLKLSVASGEKVERGQIARDSRPARKPFGKAADSKRFKPGAKKPVINRRVPKKPK
ncbi:MAG: DEAD/DEAH box helicase [Desulfuromonadales bacterium]|nr:DEAD/DEAH box helicase [Desulfuromonadales bacterium]